MSTTTKVAYVAPAIGQNGQQKTWTKDGQTNYFFQYNLENGMQGEVMHKTQQPRFQPGDEVIAELKPSNGNYPPGLKLDKPGQSGGKFGGGKAWSPEKEAQIAVQGLVQAAITSGAKTHAEIAGMVTMGLQVRDEMVKMVLSKTQQQAPQQQQAAPQPWQNGGMNAQGFHQPPGAPPSMRQPLPQNPGANGTWQGSGAPKPQYQEETGPF